MARSSNSRKWLCGFGAMAFSLSIMLWSPPCFAEWPGSKLFRKPEPATPVAQQGFAGTVRRLMKQAQTEAERGNFPRAHALAQRAHKLAVTCRTSLANDPDCSPEATEEVVKYYAKQLPPSKPVVTSAPVSNMLDPSTMLDYPTIEDTPFIPPAPVDRASKPTIKQKPSSTSAGASPSQSRAEFEPNQPAKSAKSSHRSRSADRESNNPFDDHRLKDEDVTTALGITQDTQWELDLDTTVPDFLGDAQPRLKNKNSKNDSEDRANSLSSTSQEKVDSSSIGVWSEGKSPIQKTSSVRNVVSLTEFFDPSITVTPSQAVRSAEQKDRDLVETDFRAAPTPVPVNSHEASVKHSDLEITKPAVEETTSAIEPSSNSSPDHSSDPTQPAVSYHEDPALDWLPTSATVSEPQPATFNWLAGLWNSKTMAHWNQFVAGGCFLLICGVGLFCLSFRRAG